MVTPSPGVRMPTMRSPGTAPPLGAKRTGKSVLMPRIGMAAPGDDAAAEAGILVAHGRAGGPADGGARLAGGNQRFPRRRRRRLRTRGDDLDLVAVGKFGDQGRDLAVDLAADRHVADIGMH